MPQGPFSYETSLSLALRYVSRPEQTKDASPPPLPPPGDHTPLVAGAGSRAATQPALAPNASQGRPLVRHARGVEAGRILINAAEDGKIKAKATGRGR